MGAIDLVVTDLDGTLWHLDRDIHPTVVPAIEELARREVPLLVATGRRAGSTRKPLARLGLAPPAVVLNGALGLDLATGERFHRMPFPPDQAAAALEAFRRVGLSPCLYVDHERYEVFVDDQPSTNPGHLRALGDAAGVTDLEGVTAEVPVLGFGLIGVEHRDLVRAAAELDGTVEHHLDRAFDYPGLASLTVAPREQSKWDGVVTYCGLHGLRADRVLALGDGTNDLELLSGAAVAVVPKNAHRSALALADHEIPPPDDGGWATVLDLL